MVIAYFCFFISKNLESCFPWFWFWFWEWKPSIGRKVGIPRGILPHVQTGLKNWNPDNSLSHPGIKDWNPDNCLGKGVNLRPVLS